MTRQARRLIESGFGNLWVVGEIANLKAYRSGHWYFSLRDEEAQVRCVMWRSDNQRLEVNPTDGQRVFVEARPTVWEERGEFRLTVRRMIPTDEGGVWQLELEKTRKRLEQDGLLDPARKRPLPRFPTHIGVVTSPDGAAIRDIITVLGRRWPLATLWLVPTRVQGEGSAREIVRAIETAGRIPGLDVLIVGRGGGSREDLWSFNDEAVCRELARSPVPTVSAVGHETDVSLTDLVADHRAATPSAGAEAVVPDLQAVGDELENLGRRLGRALTHPVNIGRERIERTGDRLVQAIQARLEGWSQDLARAGGKLEALSPLKTLARGYAVARDESGRVLKTVSDFPAGREFGLTVSDGTVNATARGPK